MEHTVADFNSGVNRCFIVFGLEKPQVSQPLNIRTLILIWGLGLFNAIEKFGKEEPVKFKFSGKAFEQWIVKFLLGLVSTNKVVNIIIFSFCV